MVSGCRCAKRRRSCPLRRARPTHKAGLKLLAPSPLDWCFLPVYGEINLGHLEVVRYLDLRIVCVCVLGGGGTGRMSTHVQQRRMDLAMQLQPPEDRSLVPAASSCTWQHPAAYGCSTRLPRSRTSVTEASAETAASYPRRRSGHTAACSTLSWTSSCPTSRSICLATFAMRRGCAWGTGKVGRVCGLLERAACGCCPLGIVSPLCPNSPCKSRAVGLCEPLELSLCRNGCERVRDMRRQRHRLAQVPRLQRKCSMVSLPQPCMLHFLALFNA